MQPLIPLTEDQKKNIRDLAHKILHYDAIRAAGIRVYIASPYTKGDVAVNVRRSIDAWDLLTNRGFFAYCPLLTHFLHMIHPRSYEEWMEIDLHWLSECNCVLRLSGESPGADREVARAHELDMRVFYDIEDLVEYYSRLLSGDV